MLSWARLEFPPACGMCQVWRLCRLGLAFYFVNVGSAILHFCLCCPGQAQTGDHAASTEDTDGKKPGGELEKAGSGWAGFAEFGACAGQGLGTGRHRRRTRT